MGRPLSYAWNAFKFTIWNMWFNRLVNAITELNTTENFLLQICEESIVSDLWALSYAPQAKSADSN